MIAVVSAGPAIAHEGPAIAITKASNRGSDVADVRVFSRWIKFAIANERLRQISGRRDGDLRNKTSGRRARTFLRVSRSRR